MPQITFRVTDEVAGRLDAVRQEKTRAEFARDALGAAMDDRSLKGVQHELTELRRLLEQQREADRQTDLKAERSCDTLVGQIADLRMDLATAVVGVLTRLGTTVPLDEAESFVARVLRCEPEKEAE